MKPLLVELGGFIGDGDVEVVLRPTLVDARSVKVSEKEIRQLRK